MTDQELRIKALELALYAFSLYPEETRAATIEEEKKQGKSLAKRSIEIAEHYYAFLNTTHK